MPAQLDRLLLLCLLTTGCATAPVPGGERAGSPQQADRQRPSDADRAEARPPLTLEDVLQLALQRNPRLRIASADLSEARGDARQATRYPNPELELELEQVPASDLDPGRGERTIALRQPIVLGGRLRHAGRAGRATVAARRAALEQRRHEVLGEVRAQVARLRYLRQAAALQQALIEEAGKTLELARARFAARAAPESEVIKTRIEVQRLRLAAQRTEQARVAARSALSALLGGTPLPPGRPAGELQSALPPLAGEAELQSDHPAIEAARRTLEQARCLLDQRRAERIPDLRVGLAVGRDADDEEFLEGGLSLPLPLFDRNQGRILAARAGVERARAALLRVEQRLAAELASALADYRSARAQALVFEQQIVPGARRSLELARDGYRAGRGTLLDLLDAQRTMADARQALLAGRRDAALARARLFGLLGPDAERLFSRRSER